MNCYIRTALIVLFEVGVLLSGHFAIAADLFEADSGSGNIYKFTPAGVRSVFASELNGPWSLTCDNSDNLFVATYNLGTIYKFTPAGVRSVFASGLIYPQSLVCDASGNLFEADTGSNKIYKFTPSGSKSLFASVINPYGLALDAESNLFVTSNYGSGSIYKFTSSGVQSTFASGLGNPYSLALDAGSNLFMTEAISNKIYKFTPSGSKSLFASMSESMKLACDGSGNLFASGNSSGNIYKFTPSGIQSTFASGLNLPRGLAFSPIPEPSALTLLVMGGVGLIVFAWRRKRPVRAIALVMVVFVASVETVRADVFNMGGTRNADGTWNGLASLEMVPVGNINNTPDAATGNIYGSVDHTYAIGKYEVTAGQYCEFLNAKAQTNPYGLYNASMWSNTYGCKIQQTGSSGSYSYSVASDYANRPVNFVSFWDAARFTNWLCNGQGIDADTEMGAYTLGGYNGPGGNWIVKNADAQWWIPSENEWYKAAYNNGGSATTDYFLYPTSSNDIPSNVLGNPTDPGNNATFDDSGYTIGSPYYLTEVGAHENSASPYGTFDQGGNVNEWNDTVIGSSRRLVGGSFFLDTSFLASSHREGFRPSLDNGYDIGFRVASIPEPGSLLMTALIAVAGLLFWWWKR
jgi:formylglycine-generating enzyme